MKTFTVFSLATLIVAIAPIKGFAHGDEVSNATALHNAIHRVEHLVAIKKIDSAFVTQFRSVSVEALVQAMPSDPAYRAVVSQYPGTDGTANRIEILLGMNAKAKKETVLPGSTAIGALMWPDKSAVILAELANHHIEEGSASDEKLDGFAEKMSGMTLSQRTDISGQLEAVADFTSTESTELYRVVLSTDGTVVSGDFVTVPVE